MCGIVASFYKDSNRLVHKNRVDLSLEMTKILSHRGPDAQNNWNDGKCYLGFRHLALVGDDSSLQPFHNESNEIHLVCNGEIYNYREFSRDLVKKGHVFKTLSDCEVIVHLYEEYGEKLCQKLNGQFAFFLWDEKRQLILAARDRFGICPLFYTLKNDRIIFASEMKAIFCDATVEKQLDLNGIAQFVVLYGPLPRRTCFQNVFQITPGACVLMNISNWKIESKRYWSIDIHDRTTSDSKNLQSNFPSLFREAVRRRTHGIFLPAVYASGGLDSSVVAWELHKLLGKVALFSLQFDDAMVDESSYQTVLAQHLNTELIPMYISTQDICDNLIDCVWHTESPLTRLAPVPMMLLSRRVRESGYKCVMSGEGADEFLAGYPVFLTNKASVEAKYASNSQFLKLFKDQSVSRFVQSSFEKIISSETTKTKSSLAKNQEIEIKTKLSQYLLSAQGDRVALANGVEQRFPFLDEPVVDLLTKLPGSRKINNGEGKVLLRKVFQHELPPEIIRRKKQGYMAPDAKIFRLTKFIKAMNNDFLSDRSIEEAGYFDNEQVRELKKLSIQTAIYDNKIAQSGWFLILTTQMLHKLFVENNR